MELETPFNTVESDARSGADGEVVYTQLQRVQVKKRPQREERA